MIPEEITRIVRPGVLKVKDLPPENAVGLTGYFSHPYLGDGIKGSITLNHKRQDENGERKPIEIIINPIKCDERTKGLIEGISTLSSTFLQLGGPIEEIIEGMQGNQGSLSWYLAQTLENLAGVEDCARRTSTPLPGYRTVLSRAFVHDDAEHPRPLILESDVYQSGQPASLRIKFGSQEYEKLLNTISSIGTRMLEYGINVKDISDALKEITFKPDDISRDFKGEDRVKSKSILDYTGKWLENNFKHNFT